MFWFFSSKEVLYQHFCLRILLAHDKSLPNLSGVNERDFSLWCSSIQTSFFSLKPCIVNLLQVVSVPITQFTSSSIRNSIKTQTPWESDQANTRLHRPNEWDDSDNSRALILMRALWLSRFISLPSPRAVPGRAPDPPCWLLWSLQPRLPRRWASARYPPRVRVSTRSPTLPSMASCPPRCSHCSSPGQGGLLSLSVDSHCLEALAGAESARRLLLMGEERQ